MQLLGHLALGYFSGSAAGWYTREKVSLPLIWVSALLPDMDMLTNGFLVHRGPTHSILLAAALFLPIWLVTRRGLPYFAALASHTLVGDFLTPPLMLFWPVTDAWFGAPGFLQMTLAGEELLEMLLFALMVAVMLIVYVRSRRLVPQRRATRP